MQLMIDTAQETPEALRLASKFLADHAALREAMEQTDNTRVLNTLAEVEQFFSDSVPAGTSQPQVPPPPAPSNVSPLFPRASVPVAAPPTDAPIVPPAPVATPTVPTVPTVPFAPPVDSTNRSAQPATMTTGVTSTTPDELDSAGVPWDARIHQKTKGRKKDLTWKLQKGIDPALVSSVMQELQAQGRVRSATIPVPTAPSVEQPNPTAVFGRTPLPVGAIAPVPLPPAAPYGQTYDYQGHAQQGQTQENGQAQSQGQNLAPVPPPPPSVTVPAGPTVPVPPAPNVGLPNTGQSNVLPMVSEFRALVSKITEARHAGKLTAEQVNAAVAKAGVTSLQMLSSMAHLVSVVDAYIDADIAMAP